MSLEQVTSPKNGTCFVLGWNLHLIVLYLEWLMKISEEHEKEILTFQTAYTVDSVRRRLINFHSSQLDRIIYVTVVCQGRLRALKMQCTAHFG